MSEKQKNIQRELKEFDGFTMPIEFSLIKERIKNFEVRNDDIWVTSYPKSGTTWTQEMVWLVANDMDYEGAKRNLNTRFPFIEYNCLFNSRLKLAKACNQEVFEKLNSLGMPDIIEVLQNTNGRRAIKSHLPWQLLPRQITEELKTPKIIHVMRNPRQVVVSYYHHNKMFLPAYIETLSDFVDVFINGKAVHGNYFNNVLSYWKQRHLPNLLIITYEEMHKDIKRVIKKVSQFLGKNYNEEVIEKLAEHLSFDQMRKNEAVNQKQIVIVNKDMAFMRKGAIDSYKTELSNADLTKVDRWVFENIKGTGLPYESS